MTPEFENAAKTGDTPALRYLLERGGDVNARDRYGQTALMLAACHGHAGVVRLLIDRDAHLNVTAKYGLSALMLSVINGHAEVARMLVRAGADTNVRGTGAPGFAGRTAYDLAADRGMTDLFSDQE